MYSLHSLYDHQWAAQSPAPFRPLLDSRLLADLRSPPAALQWSAQFRVAPRAQLADGARDAGGDSEAEAETSQSRAEADAASDASATRGEDRRQRRALRPNTVLLKLIHSPPQ